MKYSLKILYTVQGTRLTVKKIEDWGLFDCGLRKVECGI